MVVMIGLLWSCDPSDDKNIIVDPIDTQKDSIYNQIDTQVNSIIFDNENTQWIATNEGLFKKVTEGFQQIITEKINTLFYEKDANLLWVGADLSLCKIDLADTNYVQQKISSSNLSNPAINAIYTDSSSRHWFGTGKGFSLNIGDMWKKENFRINIQNNLFAMDIEKNQINSIASWDGDYYFGTSGARLYRAFGYNESVDAFSGATQWIPPYNGESITDTIFVVFIDKDGKQWFGGKDGIQVHTGHEPKDMGSFTYYYRDEANQIYDLPDNYVLAINQAPDGKIWIGTRKGLAVFDGESWQTITDGLPDLYVKTIAFDNSGNVWIGTKTGMVNL